MAELDQLLEDAPMPFIMQHAVKISIVRKRVSSLNTLLKSIQRRLDNVDRMLTVGLLQGIYLHIFFVFYPLVCSFFETMKVISNVGSHFFPHGIAVSYIFSWDESIETTVD